ncbi:VanZ family protein [Azospirillum halopraeferens]|uniref:VanZ family protein n=1 Tax=Azospirillum halopraeferens TaxID=34010 RepID=UPI00041098E1|nr:VanZ family protein [Azospirillum halopraeferens]
MTAFTPALRRTARRLLVPLLVVVVAGAIVPQLAPPGTRGIDKLFHAGAFAALAFGVALAAGSRRQLFAGWLLLALMSFGIEGAQALVPGRSPSLTDGLASLLGVAAGAGAAAVAALHQRRILRLLRGVARRVPGRANRGRRLAPVSRGGGSG